MCSGGEGKQWSCGKAGVVSLQKVGSLVRDLSEPCLSQSRIQIGKMLKPEKWQASFDSDGRVSGFQKALKLIILGGIDPSIRAEVWEFLLGCYALSSTSEYRNQLRVARRKRYNDLLKQCQTMHSSVGTGSLAYVVGSKVMDMRKSYRDEAVKVATTDENREDAFIDNNDNANTENHHSDWSNNGTDTSHLHRRGSSSESVDLVSGRESPESVVYNTSSFVSASSPYGYASPDGYFDFPSLPVTDLFGRNSLDKIEVSTPDEDASLKSELRSEDEGMHNFRIDKNADLIREQRRSTPEIKVMHSDSVGPSSYTGRNAEIVDGLRISDVPEMASVKDTPSRVGNVTEDRVSEWLWTLHRIVVDVVRTDSHLEFYEDPGNLGRMSDILAVYAWVDPATGYCQGMSDLVSPFVVLFEDNADAFWCFEMLIRRTRANFQMEGPTGVMDQLQSLWHILQITDKDIFSHLSRIGAESLHFAFRMLLVLFRRELSFNEALRMWEMMWAADYDESVTETLENDCLEPLVIQLPRKSEPEVSEEMIEDGIGNSTKREPMISKSGPISKSSGLLSRSGLLPKSGPLPKTAGPFSDESEIKSASSSYHFCGLTRSLWSRNDRTTHVPCVVSSIKKGDDALPVFCVAAILIMNRHKIMKETRSIDDMIQIFNDKVLVFRVRRCIRTAMKLRRKYMYKSQVIKTKSHTQSQNLNQVHIQHQTHMESQRPEEIQSHGENQSQTPSFHHSPATQNGD
ncbi:Ypt/Rab-GAP domain of gyp1p superfamily protein [Arabidopsis thaliana]|uniref:Ypt/Rab-GAP domain of gyp1p superfamily protein n=1 Tax=Arabidopsis thaliana TaxID=3702 RepID=F4IR57_ARATH|nr:Ypt/Rab-GAP domain of gyp1p superfamily protein [Arabidopsis thaliana]NP_001323830.1 Ypt/Rab-GAP domain of gyp1p superfamily protein [Arabidopsis thaliana]AEC10281.1 Ypt/Rab-GAP domain of gyp1p superfamily protein [Arabidopsis thaliana]ANM61625.1 Ypt/Rab-GAP domain of gyp1p superfamily protein [Arabidopsis thaliana]|eukprot:NP_001189743.1 Ypt/Rab-GAP domain of gyp1p superfamily protein [Arabidopsis thaliana]